MDSLSAADKKLGFWAQAIIFSTAVVLALATASECKSITHWPSLLYGIYLWVWWGVIGVALWRLGQRRPFVSSFSPGAICLHVLAGAGLGVAHLMLVGSLSFFVPEWRLHASAWSVWTSQLHPNQFGLEFLIYGFLFGITAVVQFQIRAQRAAMHALELQRQLSAAHLHALQMQLEPHFLFNTLNAITTLVELGRQEAATEMLGHLNAILKNTLAHAAPEKVPLSQELEFVGNYLAIEQVRFADRLRVLFNVDPSALDGLVPNFLLQPIVENAIRHGIAQCEQAGVVEASAKRFGNELRMVVRDTGRGASWSSEHAQQHGHGIGLTNTRERLAHFYPEGYTMEAQSLNTGGFEVAITIPYERAG